MFPGTLYHTRDAGIVVDEYPKFFANIPSLAHHSLYFPDHDLCIPLAFDEIISYFPFHVSRREELSDPSLILPLAPSLDNRNPHDATYKK